MMAVYGTYLNGVVTTNQEFKTDKPVKVKIYFLEDVEPTSTKGLTFDDFSFAETRKILENFKGTPFSEEVISERRNGI